MNADALAATKNDVLPLTGAEYLESLRESREIYIYGERVKDVTTHPAFRNSCRMAARVYDALHAPETKDVLTCPTDAGNGGFTHKFFRVDRSADAISQIETRGVDYISDVERHSSPLNVFWMLTIVLSIIAVGEQFHGSVDRYAIRLQAIVL